MPNTKLDKAYLCESILKLKDKKVLILGDVMLDVYLQGDAERISPEAPVPVVNIATQKYMLGGAANVARNIRSIGGVPTLIGLCGSGPDGQKLVQLLDDSEIIGNVLSSARRKTIVKTRIMAQGQQMLRFDKEDCLGLSDDEASYIQKSLRELMPEHQIMIVSDYAKGLINIDIREQIQKISKAMPSSPEILVDPKPNNAVCYTHSSLMTPNRKEAAQMAHIQLSSRENIVLAGRRIMDAYMCKELLITLGAEGMALFAEDGAVWNIAPSAKAVFDVTGAGDTVISSLALGRAAGLDMVTCSVLATYAAGLVLEHVGVACVSADDIVQVIERSHMPQCVRWD